MSEKVLGGEKKAGDDEGRVVVVGRQVGWWPEERGRSKREGDGFREGERRDTMNGGGFEVPVGSRWPATEVREAVTMADDRGE